MIKRILVKIKCFFEYVSFSISPLRYWRKRGLKAGKNFRLCNHVDFGSEPYLIIIGDDVTISRYVRFITHDGGLNVLRNKYKKYIDKELFGKIKIGNNVLIGLNSTILPNVKIGNNVIVGACSVVTKDIPDNSVVCGNPAKVIKTLDEYKLRINDGLVDTHHMNSKKKRKFLENYYNKH